MAAPLASQVSSPASVLMRQQGLEAAGLQGDEAAAVVFSQLQQERPFSELVFQGGFFVCHTVCVLARSCIY